MNLAPQYDLAIIGGGINGCGIARDAAGRGLSVYLCEQGDFAGATSSASTKLIHGGLRYLEQYQFRLVHEALAEREVMLRIAPHLVRPLRFVLPHHKGLRPRWFLRLGLFVYDHLGGRITLPRTASVDLWHDPAGAALKREYRFAFEYSDCAVDDARLVIANAIDARARGAVLERNTRCVTAERGDKEWRLTVKRADGSTAHVTSRVLVNASGPWVGDVARDVVKIATHGHLRLDKGSHIVVRRLFEHDRAYIFQNADKRVVFAIPYQRDFTLIGTTEEDYRGDPAKAAIDQSEIDYLCATASEYFRKPVTPSDIVWTYAGVRPLYAEAHAKPQDVSRDYVLDLDAAAAPLLTIYGGKITTYRRLAESALRLLRPHAAMGAPWTVSTPLPGGDLPKGGIPVLIDDLRRSYPFLTLGHASRLAHSYGTRAFAVLGTAKGMDDLGRNFGADLTEAEVRYLVDHEWAMDAADILWRRTKLGLHLSAGEIAAFQTYMTNAVPRAVALS